MTTTASQALVESWLPTHYLAEVALTGYSRHDTSEPLWPGIDVTEDGARAYYRSLDDETLRVEAAEILAGGGWTVSDVAYRFS